MDKIRVNTDLLEDCAGLIGTCGTSASSLAQEIAQVLSSLPESCTEKYSRVISSYKKEMQSISNDLGYLKTGVTKAARLFDECEQTLQQGVPNESGEGAFASVSGGGESKIDWNAWPFTWIDAVLDFLNIDEYGRDYVDPGAEAQQAQDALMRGQIEDLFYNSRYGEETWENASTAEKEQILNEFKNNVNSIYGTTVTADIEYYEGPAGECGYYWSETNKVYINKNYLATTSREDAMNTVVHELRHAYQNQVVNDPGSYVVSEENARAWEENNKPGNYVVYDSSKGNYDEYYNQPVEADAFGFADSVDYSSKSSRRR